jgi:hypothetical protein
MILKSMYEYDYESVKLRCGHVIIHYNLGQREGRMLAIDDQWIAPWIINYLPGAQLCWKYLASHLLMLKKRVGWLMMRWGNSHRRGSWRSQPRDCGAAFSTTSPLSTFYSPDDLDDDTLTLIKPQGTVLLERWSYPHPANSEDGRQAAQFMTSSTELSATKATMITTSSSDFWNSKIRKEFLWQGPR